MNLFNAIYSRLRGGWQRREVKRQIDEELRFHMETRVAENIAAGLSPQEAAREARKRFGNLQSVREECRDVRGASLGETLTQDIRFGLRMLRRNPGFTAVAVVSLGLGIGANTAIFSLVNAVLLRSLPVPNPHELRAIEWQGSDLKNEMFTGRMQDDGPGRSRGDSVSYPLFAALREQCAAQADLFGYANLNDITVRARREAFIAEGLVVSDNFFSGLRARALFGRLLGEEDARAGAPLTAVITSAWWEKQFDSDPGVLGQPVTLNGHAFTIVGVLPRGFPGVHPGDRIEFYVPMSARSQLMANWSPTSPKHWWVRFMARLKPGVSDSQFQAALDVVFTRQIENLMTQPKLLVSDGRAGPEAGRNYYRKPLTLLLVVVGVVLLIACANLASLSLSRGAARQHEFAVRAAIGAGRWRLMRQSLTEGLLIALLGGGLGILVALWGRTVVSRLLAGNVDGLHYDTSLDLRVLGFTLAVALGAGLFSGLLPALRAGSVDPQTGIRERAALGAPRLRAGKVLVAAQIALSVLLLVGAGLYVRTLVNLVSINPGFRTENLLLFKVNPRNAGYQGGRTTEFYSEVQRSLAAIPGVGAVTLTQYALLGGWMSGGGFFTLPGHPFEGDLKPQAHRLAVSETFFTTMGIPLLLGRGFTEADVDGAPKVVVVNRTFAQRYLPNEDPVGQTLKANDTEWQIVGVCRDAKYTDIKAAAPPTVYFTFRQDSVGSAFFALRTALPPMAVANAARKAVAAIDPNVPLTDISTQEQVRDSKISQERLFAELCGSLASLAVLLSCIGLYGLMAYNVERRTREIGIRMALGATRRNVAGPILREAVLLAAAGLAIGMPVALGLTRLIRSNLYGVAPSDPLTMVSAVVALWGVALVAAWIPARRAARVDPMVALRCE